MVSLFNIPKNSIYVNEIRTSYLKGHIRHKRKIKKNCLNNEVVI